MKTCCPRLGAVACTGFLWALFAFCMLALWPGLVGAQPAAPASAPSETPSAAFPFRDAKEGISCTFFDVALGLHWPDGAPAWVDAAGQTGGAKAFDVQTLESREPPKVLRWNVLALVKGWASGAIENEGLVLAPVAGKPGGGADFYSREAEDVGVRPSLRVQHGNGSVEFLSAQADAHLDCSTYTSLGTQPVLHVGPASVGVLRFDLSRLRKGSAQQATAADLVLVRNPAVGVWSNGTLGVFRLATPWNQNFPAPERGLASAHPGDHGIAANPDVLWADNFLTPKLKPGWNQAHMVRSKVMPPLAAPSSAGPLLTLASLQATIPRGDNLGLDLRYDFQRTPGKPDRSEAYFRYYLRLGPEWADSPASGKMPGFAGTYNRVAWGGRGWNGMQGWSARGSFTQAMPPGHPLHRLLPLASYVYHSKSASGYGEVLVWGGSKGAAFIPTNRWVCVEQHIKLNTPGREDGLLRAWVDGKPVFARSNFRFRDTLDVGIENVWFDLYMGGQQPALKDMNINIAQVVVATRYIGPMAP